MPRRALSTLQSFADLGLSRPLLKACAALGYASPTPIQAACIPLAMAGRDICGSAVTGSGKTAAFGLPTLERLLHRDKRLAATYVLVLTPVRELAVQVRPPAAAPPQAAAARVCGAGQGGLPGGGAYDAPFVAACTLPVLRCFDQQGLRRHDQQGLHLPPV